MIPDTWELVPYKSRGWFKILWIKVFWPGVWVNEKFNIVTLSPKFSFLGKFNYLCQGDQI